MKVQSWNEYVAIGDSFTEGIGDPVDGVSKLGAMDRVAAALKQSNPNLKYTNLAKRGLLVAEIREQQLQAALHLKPDFVTIVAGSNDILAGRFNPIRWEQELRTLYKTLAATGAVVSTGNIPNFPVLRTLKEPLQLRVNNNIAIGNDIIQRLAAQYQIILVDAWTISCSHLDGNDWSTDGIHPNSRGYLKFAKEILKTIEQHTGTNIGSIETP